MSEDMKKCIKCNELKPATFEFFGKMKGKLRNECKECSNRRHVEWNKKNREKRRAYDKQYGKENRQKLSQKNKKWTEEIMKNSPSNLTYSGLHMKIKELIQDRELCLICNEKKKLQLASIDHEYTEDPKDWLLVCTSCHRVFDKCRGEISV